MKKILYIIILIFSLNIFSQTKEDCLSNLSIFAEYAKVKNYDAAYEPWSNVKRDCPEINSAIYVFGERILKYFIKKSSSEADQNEYKKDLLNLYDDWLEYFPKTKRGKNQSGKILATKAQSMIDYSLGSKQDIYNVFDNAFKEDQSSFSSPKGLYNYFKTYYNLYKVENSSVTLEELFEKYEELSEKFELEMNSYTSKLDLLLKKEEK